MGLDNYFKATSNSPRDIVYPQDLNLCGGMLSGHGSTGSFRGKVYADFFNNEVGVSLYSDASPKEVAVIAEKLVALLRSHPEQAWDDGWRSDAPSSELSYSGVTHRELCDLAALFRAAANQSLQLVASY